MKILRNASSVFFLLILSSSQALAVTLPSLPQGFVIYNSDPMGQYQNYQGLKLVYTYSGRSITCGLTSTASLLPTDSQWSAKMDSPYTNCYNSLNNYASTHPTVTAGGTWTLQVPLKVQTGNYKDRQFTCNATSAGVTIHNDNGVFTCKSS